MSFTFGDRDMQSFEQHKQAFAQRYNNGQDINYNLEHCGSAFLTKVGKNVDFHEDILKQMFVKMQQQEQLKKNCEHNFIILENKVGQLSSKLELLLCEEQLRQDKDVIEEKKTRYVELMKELRELENDLKFHKRDN
jgi:hypothetical protein